MAGRDWSAVVEEAVRRHVDSTRDPVFTPQELIDSELNRIVSETGSEGETPHMTLSRELQQLRDAGVLEFVDDRVTYRLVSKLVLCPRNWWCPRNR
jgi:putative restriction endonuclease